ncbi:hypothetical protein [Stenotrophomonas sp. 24(2023)]|uniref:hypothetical protein n=1 Tax=Stenotrophomonas sp. 24(2023) TaxID=3068324 RepID=UPI0027DF0B3E|nr:hypothetical protein [Stenotrophomonas sp. 24(2023)]WMJ69529.1 hypothetical protein Q9R17_20505 [Stenotrophomonas sp. 24(2023)]
MEGRTAASAARAANAPASGRRRTWLLLGLVGSVVVIAGLLAWGLSSDDSGSSNVDAYSLAPDSGAAHPAAPAATPPAAGGAMIVDAPADPAAVLPAPVDTPADTAAVATAPVAAAAAAAVPAPSAGSTTAAKRAAPAAARSAGGKTQGDENLLGTLLGIIKEDEKAKTKAKTQPQNMDDLIAQIESDQRKRSEEDRAAFERVASKKSASTESSIQAQLRSCPSPASLKGVDCRRKICAKVVGTDPACPAM